MKAYFSDGLKLNYRKEVTAICGYLDVFGIKYQKLEPTEENFKILLSSKTFDDKIIIKDNGELISTHNPLYIYGEHDVKILTVNDKVIFTRPAFEIGTNLHNDLIKTELEV